MEIRDNYLFGFSARETASANVTFSAGELVAAILILIYVNLIHNYLNYIKCVVFVSFVRVYFIILQVNI